MRFTFGKGSQTVMVVHTLLRFSLFDGSHPVQVLKSVGFTPPTGSLE